MNKCLLLKSGRSSCIRSYFLEPSIWKKVENVYKNMAWSCIIRFVLTYVIPTKTSPFGSIKAVLLAHASILIDQTKIRTKFRFWQDLSRSFIIYNTWNQIHWSYLACTCNAHLHLISILCRNNIKSARVFWLKFSKMMKNSNWNFVANKWQDIDTKLKWLLFLIQKMS